MSRLVIHIGTHKTGTTHIQNLFRSNARRLRARGMIMPKLPAEHDQHILTAAWNPRFAVEGIDPRALWQDLAREFAGTDSTVFISSEELSRMRPMSVRTDMAEMRALVRDFDEVTMLCTLRSQASFLQSIYQQISANRAPPPFPEFLEAALDSHFAEGLSLHYSRLYSHLMTGFARTEIRLLSYEEECAAPGGLAAAFLRELRLDMPVSALAPVGRAASNVSPQPLVTLVAAHVARPDPPGARLLALVGKVFARCLGADRRSTLYLPDEIRRIGAHFAPINAGLSERIALYQPTFRVAQMQPEEADTFRDGLPAEFWSALGDALGRKVTPLA